MDRTAIFAWEGTEYEFGEKSADWYWALGIIATAAIIASILFNNILLALVIAAGAGAMGVQAAKQSHVHRFAIYEDGLSVDENLYPFTDMLHFSVLEYPDPTLPPALSIKTKHILSPHLLIPIHTHDPLQLYTYIFQHVPEGRHEESIVDRFVEFLRL